VITTSVSVLRGSLRWRVSDDHLLAAIDVPWVADGIRDRGHRREEMQSLFQKAVEDSGVSWTEVAGTWEDRWNVAVDAVATLLQKVER
jgi:nicotinamide riboside kinase